MYVRAKIIFGVFFAEKDLLLPTETTAQRYLWLYHRAVVRKVYQLSLHHICILKGLAWDFENNILGFYNSVTGAVQNF